jgi:putative endonuclease
MPGNYYVYILTNRFHTVLYTGVTNDLIKRIQEHKLGALGGFTKKYNLHKLVYYEHFEDINFAIEREKQLKGGSRAKKLKLILSTNPGWSDLVLD